MSKENSDENKTKSVVLGLPGTAQKFCKYVDAKFVDCTELMRFEPYVTYNNTHLSNFLARESGVEAIYCPIMDNGDRETFLVWARELGYKTPNFIHPKAEIDPVVKKKLKATPNAGIYIFEDAKIGPNVEIGESSIVTWKVCIAEGAKLEQGVFISTGIKLGKDCTVCRHSHVDENVPEGATVAGIPAKILKPEDLNK